MTKAVELAQVASTGVSEAFKNRIINGAMVIDQRNAGASGTANDYTVDRFAYAGSQSSKATWQQNAGSVTPPVGFTNYLGATSSSAYSVLAGDYFFFYQRIEGYNIADLNWGSANAKTVTLSFWVRSSLTGTFGGSLRNNAGDRSYPYSYTINAANTWEYKTITIAGDTSGTWLTTNGQGMQIGFAFGVGSTFSNTAGTWAAGNYLAPTGSTSVVGTNGATFYITGVQLEVGSSATSFEYRSYGTELALCQRYYWQIQGNVTNNTSLGLGFSNSGTNNFSYLKFPVSMRSTPTISGSSGVQVSDLNSYTLNATSVALNSGDTNGMNLIGIVSSGLTTLRPGCNLLTNSTSSYLGLSAEL